MAKKQIIIGLFVALSMILLGAATFASVAVSAYWQNGAGSSFTLVNGASAYFDAGLFTMAPPLTYSMRLFNSSGALLSTLRSGTVSGTGFYQDRVFVNPADYGNAAGSYIISVVGSDADGITHTAVLSLTVNSGASAITFSGMPASVSMTTEPYTAFDLDDFVSDLYYPDSALIWAVSGNDNITVGIDANHVVTFYPAPGFLGSNTITFIVTDPSGNTASGTLTVTVRSGAVLVTSKDTNEPRHRITLDASTGSWLMVRNQGSSLEDARIKVTIEGEDLVGQTFNMDLDKNRLVYLPLSFDLSPGTYLARVEVDGEDDFQEKRYLLMELA